MTQIRFIRKENQPLYHNESPWIRSGKARFRCSNNVPSNPKSVRAHAFLCGSSILRRAPPSNGKTPNFNLTNLAIPARSKSLSISFPPTQLPSSLTRPILNPWLHSEPILAWARKQAGRRDPHCQRVTNSTRELKSQVISPSSYGLIRARMRIPEGKLGFCLEEEWVPDR